MRIRRRPGTGVGTRAGLLVGRWLRPHRCFQSTARTAARALSRTMPRERISPHCRSARTGRTGTLTVSGGRRAALPAVLALPFFPLLLSAFPLPAGVGVRGSLSSRPRGRAEQTTGRCCCRPPWKGGHGAQRGCWPAHSLPDTLEHKDLHAKGLIGLRHNDPICYPKSKVYGAPAPCQP